jgi:hypothetical protein
LRRGGAAAAASADRSHGGRLAVLPTATAPLLQLDGQQRQRLQKVEVDFPCN